MGDWLRLRSLTARGGDISPLTEFNVTSLAPTLHK